MADDDSILKDLAAATGLIQVFKEGLGREGFLADPRTQYAILFQLALIAEAVHRLSQEHKDRHPQINWFLLAGLRDRLLHSRAAVDMSEIWKILETQAVPLAAALETSASRVNPVTYLPAPVLARPGLSRTGELIKAIRDQFQLEWEGEHGIFHFWAVRETGLWLAPRTGADPAVVEAFALLHDACRADEYEDDVHAAHALDLAQNLKDVLELDPGAMRLLKEAILKHHLGILTPEPTLGTCWDADQLDIGRIGGAGPDVGKLNTKAARDKKVIEWAYKRSRGEKAEMPK
jgi:uncharacterized protein